MYQKRHSWVWWGYLGERLNIFWVLGELCGGNSARGETCG